MLTTVSAETSPLLPGAMDLIQGDMLHGWLLGVAPDVRPLVLVNDEPAVLTDAAIPRPDVCQKFGFTGPDTVGFACRLPAAPAGAVLSLYGVTADGVFLSLRRSLAHPVCEQGLEAQLRRAAATARRSDAVGIVCWDGAHNPIGRAKVLYDIAACRRPAVLLCYLHEEFGGSLWPPLLHCDFPLVAIPWKQRHEAHILLRRYGIVFNTVWICKPRLPSFRLAAAVSHDQTRFLLDIDDDEDAFSARQPDSRACYDAPGLPLAHFLRDAIPARTVVSPPLRACFGGHIVRHARSRTPRPTPDGNGRDVYHIGFIGTARPHKNVLAAARAVRLLAATTGLPLRFHCCGDVQPPEYRDKLLHAGAELHGTVSLADLPAATARMHVLISGYPAAARDDAIRAVAAHQTPAKISDALAAGRPILVPDGPAIADLRNLPGIYPFTERTFTDQLVAALSEKRPVTLPDEFTPEGACAAFAAAEQEAVPVPALRILDGLPPQTDEEDGPPALVLLWKQHDAGLYGRRVDQIARSYRRAFPGHRVIILEFFEDHLPDEAPRTAVSVTDAETFEQSGNATPEEKEQDASPLPEEDFTGEEALRSHLLALKLPGLMRDGVFLRTLRHGSGQELRDALFAFLVREKLSPDNSLFVLFPIIEALEEVEDILRPYVRLIDVVDNQLGWAADDARRCRLLDQYFRLAASAAQLVFNTEQMRAFFAERHFPHAADAAVIPNWYTPPDGVVPAARPLPGPERHIFYSGNMNDRLDWPLLQAVAVQPGVRLHLAGTAQRARAALDALIARGVIYHGVTEERETLAILSRMDAAIVPHVLDDISMFMNPIKIGMYRAAGLPILCPSRLRLAGDDLLVYDDTPHCLRLLSTLPERRPAVFPRPVPASRKAEQAYMRLLARLHPEKNSINHKIYK